MTGFDSVCLDTDKWRLFQESFEDVTSDSSTAKCFSRNRLQCKKKKSWETLNLLWRLRFQIKLDNSATNSKWSWLGLHWNGRGCASEKKHEACFDISSRLRWMAKFNPTEVTVFFDSWQIDWRKEAVFNRRLVSTEVHPVQELLECWWTNLREVNCGMLKLNLAM